MRADDRQEVAHRVQRRRVDWWYLATKAFGMGIDISDITHVYHHAPSGNLSDYVQEIGRVARDKSLRGLAQTDYSTKDLKYSRILFRSFFYQAVAGQRSSSKESTRCTS